MSIDWRLVLPLLALALLAVLVTGPGLWSDRWGHGWLRRVDGRQRGRDAERRRVTPR
jgi:hypothetical protein